MVDDCFDIRGDRIQIVHIKLALSTKRHRMHAMIFIGVDLYFFKYVLFLVLVGA